MKLLREMHEDSQWLIRMVENLLSVTKIDDGVARISKIPVVLEALVYRYVLRLLKLTRTEYNILEILSKNTGKVLTYAAIIRNIWGPTDDGGVKKLQVNMANIRKKLGSKPGDNKYVINELGVGYRMSEEGEMHEKRIS